MKGAGKNKFHTNLWKHELHRVFSYKVPPITYYINEAYKYIYTA